MKAIIFALCLTLCALPQARANAISVTDALAIQRQVAGGSFEARAAFNALVFYLQGVLEGVGGYQDVLQSGAKKRAFCPPQDKGYSIPEVLDILDATPKAERGDSAAQAIIRHYAQRYPC